MVGLHGTGGTPRLMARFTHLPEVALARGFAVALPGALGSHGAEDPATGAAWNVGPGLGHPGFTAVDDAGFLCALAGTLAQEHPVDPGRTALVGFSNGARMGWRLLLERPEAFRAFALVSGAPHRDLPVRTPRRPVAVIHGRADRHIPYEGGVGAVGRHIPNAPVPETVHRLALAMGLPERPRRRFLGEHTCDRYGEDDVVFWSLAQGHAWPGGRPYAPGADAPAPDFEASSWILSYVSERLP